MKYPEFKAVNYSEIANEILTFWNEQQIFQKSINSRQGKPGFIFYEGPPSANGTPGIHHVMARTIKDIFCRYKTLKGYQVERKGGWDTHGLPVELQVEKELNITKEDIGKKISVAEYNKKCKETVLRYTDQWNELTQKMGYWVDLNDPYITFKNEYIESIWWLLKKLYDKDLLYKGFTIQPYSPAAGTGLSSHELNQPGCYREVKDTSMTAQFKIIIDQKAEKLDAMSNAELFILAWTTTPWTLPANTALTIGKNIIYAIVDTFNPYTHLRSNVILAKDLIHKYFSVKGENGDFETFETSDKKTIPWKILAEVKGEELEGISYEQLMPYVQPAKPAFRVISGDFVTTDDGTGIVHTAPTFGSDDFRVALQNNIPPILVVDENGKEMPIVDRTGRYVSQITDFAGEYVKEAYYSSIQIEEERQKQDRPKYLSVDERIAIKLKIENRAFNVQRYEHAYPHCWRTDKPILYYPLDSWFVKTTAAKDKLVALNNTINWKPESTGSGRFGNWLENLVDWNLSRSRYWGSPLPIWRNVHEDQICIGSLKELANEIALALESGVLNENEQKANTAFLEKYKNNSPDFDIHRPYVDEVVLVRNSRPLYREPDLIDVWFDSGAMPYAQWHYPFENNDLIDENKTFPADFISEGVDQTRGWFFTLHTLAGMIFNNVAFKNVVSTGLVLDRNGNKMSKRLGNAIDPFSTLETYGADPTRWYMITNAQPWENLKFDLAGITEARNKFFGTLTNTYNFFALYANLDSFSATGDIQYHKTTELDRWILSKLQSLIKVVDEAYATYEPTKAGRAIQEFVTDQLSNWYIRLSRRRFWNPGEEQSDREDKNVAYETLTLCLKNVAQLMAPIAPFYADWLYRNFEGHQASVHLSDFPKAKAEWLLTDLEESMEIAQEISSMVHALRKGHKIKVRQPLSKILIPVVNPNIKDQISHLEELIRNEVNVKEIQYLDDTSDILNKKVKPNFKILGPKYGKQIKSITDAIGKMSQEQIRQLEKKGQLKLDFGVLMLEDVEILSEDLPGFLTAQYGALTVALDVHIDENLKQEGIARDVVNRIQNLRKDKGFDVTDKILIRLDNQNSEFGSAIRNFSSYIKQEVQAADLRLEVLHSVEDEIEIDEQKFAIEIKVLN